MRSDEYLWKVCMEIYRKQYELALPRADLDKLMRARITKRENWFWRYFLPTEVQEKVIDEVSKKYNLGRLEKEKVNGTVWLGASPTASFWRWVKSRYGGVLKISKVREIGLWTYEGEVKPDIEAKLILRDDECSTIILSQKGRNVTYVVRGRFKVVRGRGTFMLEVPEDYEARQYPVKEAVRYVGAV